MTAIAQHNKNTGSQFMKISQSLRFAAITFALIGSSSIFAATEVKVGMSGRYFPFTFVKQDQLQGFEVDLWQEIGKRNDYKVDFVTANFSGLFGLLETGRIDTISNQITITPSAKTNFYSHNLMSLMVLNSSCVKETMPLPQRPISTAKP